MNRFALLPFEGWSGCVGNMHGRLTGSFRGLGPPGPADLFYGQSHILLQAPHFVLQWKDPDSSPMGSEIQKAGGIPESH